jgi:hypothetical protein
MNQGVSKIECTDCVLSDNKIRLNSPFGYNKAGAEAFTSLTSSCSKTGYAVSSPAAYALTTSTTSSASSVATYPPSCVSLYNTIAGDTCDSIAVARNVSSFAVYGANGIRDCSNIASGKKLCLLGQCKRYRVQAGDTCSGIIASNNLQIDAEIFAAWNPNINAQCTNLEFLVNQYICLRYVHRLQVPENWSCGIDSRLLQID